LPKVETFCQITIGRSTTADVEQVLGSPQFSHDAGRGSVSYTYEYDGGQTLRMSFRMGLLHDAAVENMPYPACWEVVP
jgi:hypothetical protein